jgi:hypothetical protein
MENFFLLMFSLICTVAFYEFVLAEDSKIRTRVDGWLSTIRAKIKLVSSRAMYRVAFVLALIGTAAVIFSCAATQPGYFGCMPPVPSVRGSRVACHFDYNNSTVRCIQVTVVGRDRCLTSFTTLIKDEKCASSWQTEKKCELFEYDAHEPRG